MVRILFLFCFCFFSATLFSQAGIFRSANSFKNNKLSKEYSEVISIGHAFGKFKVVFEDKNGKKIKIKCDHKKMWGFRTESGAVYRISRHDVPFEIIEAGKIFVYRTYGSYQTEDEDEDEDEESSTLTYTSNSIPKISLGPKGKMVVLPKLKKLLKKANDPAAKDVKNNFLNQEIYDFIIEYNAQHREKQKN